MGAVDEQMFFFDAPDGPAVATYRWAGDAPPLAIVHLAHGMGEHAARYRRLADALTEGGYVVYANDHRGHGRTAGSTVNHGDLGAGGWPGLVSDISQLSSIARREYPGLPLVVVGHSMGSFALQGYLLDNSGLLDGAVLSGTSAMDVIAPGIDPTKEADLTAFNAAFAPARTDYDWLSRDPDEVDAYVADPACGFGLNPESMASMLGAMAETADPGRLSGIRPDLPILLLSGDADPLAGGGSLIDLVADRYRQAGVQDVTVALYRGARHEVFNETNRDEVTADLVTWLDRVTGR
jgi:alpha-beta hydrolase superfamily lysophospholipase